MSLEPIGDALFGASSADVPPSPAPGPIAPAPPPPPRTYETVMDFGPDGTFLGYGYMIID